jgi:pimeloyl-ACP methyl ester carboxylesterase
MGSTPAKSVVFISGTFINNNCWDGWIIYFQNSGYKCIAPSWPHKEATAEELRNKSQCNAIALNTIGSLTDHFAAIINALPGKPILIGHSLGGIIVQLLLQRELGAAGVAIRSFPPSSAVCFRFLFLRVMWEAMALFSSDKKSYLMPFSTWRYAVANGMEYDLQKELYYLYAIPESKKIVREVFKCIAKIDFKKSHAPLLITSGGKDRLIPASSNYCNYKKYSAVNSITDYQEFKDHNHLVFGHPAWQKEADSILHWLKGLK